MLRKIFSKMSLKVKANYTVHFSTFQEFISHINFWYLHTPKNKESHERGFSFPNFPLNDIFWQCFHTCRCRVDRRINTDTRMSAWIRKSCEGEGKRKACNCGNKSESSSCPNVATFQMLSSTKTGCPPQTIIRHPHLLWWMLHQLLLLF